MAPLAVLWVKARENGEANSEETAVKCNILIKLMKCNIILYIYLRRMEIGYFFLAFIWHWLIRMMCEWDTLWRTHYEICVSTYLVSTFSPHVTVLFCCSFCFIWEFCLISISCLSSMATRDIVKWCDEFVRKSGNQEERVILSQAA